MPAARTAVNALPVVRKWNSLGCGTPRVVTAVSRFTAVKSAALSTGLIGLNATSGCLSSRAVRPAKLTSPANASVTSCAAAARRAAEREPGLGLVPGPGWAGEGEEARCDGAPAEHPARTRVSGTAASRRRIGTSPGYGPGWAAARQVPDCGCASWRGAASTEHGTAGSGRGAGEADRG